jgi:hypothetical protein
MICSPRGELTSDYKCGDSIFSFEEGENLTKLWTDLPSGMQRKLNDKIWSGATGLQRWFDKTGKQYKLTIY